MYICLYVCHIIWSGTTRGWKRMLDLLELELQVVSNPVWVLGRAASSPDWSTLFSASC